MTDITNVIGYVQSFTKRGYLGVTDNFYNYWSHVYDMVRLPNVILPKCIGLVCALWRRAPRRLHFFPTTSAASSSAPSWRRTQIHVLTLARRLSLHHRHLV